LLEKGNVEVTATWFSYHGKIFRETILPWIATNFLPWKCEKKFEKLDGPERHQSSLGAVATKLGHSSKTNCHMSEKE